MYPNQTSGIGTTLAVVGLILLSNPSLPAHELEDGVVERDIQIVVFPDRVEIDYTLEMNATTRDKLLADIQPQAGKDTFAIPTTDPAAIRKAWDEFREQYAAQLAKSLVVQIDQVERKLETAKSETVEKHSIRLNYVFQYKYQVDRHPHTLVVMDKGFTEQGGYQRMALKGRRQVQIKDSTSPPTVSSLPRTPWSKLSERAQKKARQVKARFYLEKE